MSNKRDAYQALAAALSLFLYIIKGKFSFVIPEGKIQSQSSACILGKFDPKVGSQVLAVATFEIVLQKSRQVLVSKRNELQKGLGASWFHPGYSV